MRVGLVSTKGGTGKTSSAVYLACGLHRLGRTLLIDADRQSSALSWSQQRDGLPFTVVSLPVRDLPRRADDLMAGYEHLVIDGPPGDLDLIRAVILSVDIAVVPVSPTGLDLSRLRPTFELLAALEQVRPVEAAVLLTKVRRGTISAREARAVLTEAGYPVLDAEIPLAEAIAGSYGSAPDSPSSYDDVLRELMT